MRVILTDDLIIFKHSVNDEIRSTLRFPEFCQTVFYNKNLMENKLYSFKGYYNKSMKRRHQARRWSDERLRNYTHILKYLVLNIDNKTNHKITYRTAGIGSCCTENNLNLYWSSGISDKRFAANTS